MRVAARAGNPVRRMCTAAAEEVAEAPGYFSLSNPNFQAALGTIACCYFGMFRWMSADKRLAADVAAHKAAHVKHEEPSPVVAAVVAAPAAPAAAPALAAPAIVAAPAGASPETWKVGDVCAFLESQELGIHAQAFKTHAVSGKLLLTLTEQDMYATLNISSPLHRKKLAMAIAELRHSSVNP